ncbi:hypothetical protein SAMN04488112_1283 [Melghirimyces thermohalophilus]|uniref:Lipoprotein n=1 Tax=Melghirimyces thermohalophilus TaxID=1236220 RepID=A0A1G6RFY5_9BACL|nr:hypothetical protein [Melghirimyces thermohalophilus]SDD02915.1 hypothetical protein SAMN04488112_1283 [Melghirimyces thermohalophilus]
MSTLRSVFTIAALCLLLTACGNPQPSLEKDLDTAVKQLERSVDGGQGNGILRMNYVTRFSWDQLYIFGPGTTAKEIDQALGFQWKKGEKLTSKLEKNEDLLVFTKEDKVIHYVNYSGHGNFAERIKPLRDDQAVFQRVEEKGKTVIRPVTSFE